MGKCFRLQNRHRHKGQALRFPRRSNYCTGTLFDMQAERSFSNVIAAKKTSQPDASEPQPASLLVKAPEAAQHAQPLAAKVVGDDQRRRDPVRADRRAVRTRGQLWKPGSLNRNRSSRRDETAQVAQIVDLTITGRTRMISPNEQKTRSLRRPDSQTHRIERPNAIRDLQGDGDSAGHLEQVHESEPGSRSFCRKPESPGRPSWLDGCCRR